MGRVVEENAKPHLHAILRGRLIRRSVVGKLKFQRYSVLGCHPFSGSRPAMIQWEQCDSKPTEEET